MAECCVSRIAQWRPPFVSGKPCVSWLWSRLLLGGTWPDTRDNFLFHTPVPHPLAFPPWSVVDLPPDTPSIFTFYFTYLPSPPTLPGVIHLSQCLSPPTLYHLRHWEKNKKQPPPAFKGSYHITSWGVERVVTDATVKHPEVIFRLLSAGGWVWFFF